MTNEEKTLKNKRELEGKHMFTKKGYEYVIIEYISYQEVMIEFVPSHYRKMVKMSAIKSGGIEYPFEKSVIAFTNNYYKYNPGSIFVTNEGFHVQIIQYITATDIEIQFLDTGYRTHVTMQNLENGQVKNPFVRNKFGGYVGIGPYNTNEYKWLYRIWYNLLIRTNDAEYYAKYHYSKPSETNYKVYAYDTVSICEEWLCYNTFAEWYLTELSKLNPEFSYEVDKDLNTLNMTWTEFQEKGYHSEKVYCPKNCHLLPHDLNAALPKAQRSSFTTAEAFQKYKIETEAKVKQLAQYYYDKQALDPIVYRFLMAMDINYAMLK